MALLGSDVLVVLFQNCGLRCFVKIVGVNIEEHIEGVLGDSLVTREEYGGQEWGLNNSPTLETCTSKFVGFL